MVKLDCVIVERYESNLIKELHKKGIAEIEFFHDDFLEKTKLERDHSPDRITEISSFLLRVRKIIDSLQRFNVKSTPFIEGLLNAEKIDKIKTGELGYNEVKSRAEGTLGKVESIVESCEQKISESDTKKSEILEKIKKYEKIKDLEIKLEYLGTSDYLHISAGIIPKSNLILLENELRKKFRKKNEFMLIEGGLIGDSNYSIGICTLKGNAEELNRILRKLGFEQVQISEGSGKIKKNLEGLKNDLSVVREEKKNAIKKLENVHKEEYKELLAIEELLKIEKARVDLPNKFGRTKKTILMKLWVPKADCERVVKLVRRETRDNCFIKIDKKPEDAPVLLKNPRYVKNFEVLTKLFSLPRYKEIDPTIFLLPTFCLFFGIMLTDAIYGVILILASIILLKKFGGYSQNAKNAATILSGAGMMAILFGILTGSYLGDFLGKYILGKDSQSIALWLDPMSNANFSFFGSQIPNAMMFLLFVCFLGLLHVYAGYFLGAYDSLRKGEIKKTFTHYLAWYFLLFGIVLTLLSGKISYPLLNAYGLYLGIILSLTGLILLFLGSGFLIFLDLIGIVGNILSYARLLAMTLTTAGIAISFNFLASIALKIPITVMGIPIIGIILAAVIFIFGHVINILINSLGAFVHSLRLHYVEHFGTYYSGGGKPFKPFKEERRYTY